MAGSNGATSVAVFLSGLLVLSCASRGSSIGNDEQSLSRRVSQGDSDLALSGQTGRHLRLLVRGLKEEESKAADHRICAYAVGGLEAAPKPTKAQGQGQQLVCTSVRDADGVATIELKDVPYPCYVSVFHDENLNGILDFASFNIVLAKKEGPAEGVGTMVFDDKEPWPFSRPVWVEQGWQNRDVTMHYGDLPFTALVKETAWKVLFELYVRLAKDLNNSGKSKSPTNQVIGPVRDGE
jgi:hypothetical protein